MTPDQAVEMLKVLHTISGSLTIISGMVGGLVGIVLFR